MTEAHKLVKSAKKQLIDDDLSIPGYDVVHGFVRRATSDLELCYTLGKLLDQRRDVILCLTKAIKERQQ